ncbi:N-formylglutamate amidohydrolase [Cesiribacter andamanensis]|uniref:N-formylglutamate amidohydrolase n=1 Tax=Cesiribacter andamanensis AMV16 TaxID=1279009 RepID=M7NT88_9BACT|nr:N-formylglutamate amidohydrolase [Cesiribacter andamanensis]EMR01694.1 N-formylglutamate amidohydrolase [Cesiribacter andamanensis AMV16]
MNTNFYTIEEGEGPLLAAAIHDGHRLRPSINAYMGLSKEERLREEDPHTGTLARLFPTHIIGHYSRFETDLNRPRNKAIYLKPEDAWGLHVWRQSIPKDEVEESLQNYDAFYAAAEALLQKKIDRWGFVFIYDLHTYNHRRGGPQARPASEEKNPEINLGLGNIDLGRWRPVIDTFTASYRSNYPGVEKPDIRENVKFEGGHFMHWVHERFGNKACSLSIEFKKTFMDEWTNELDQNHLHRIGQALKATAAPVLERAATLIQRPDVHDRGTYSTNQAVTRPDKERQERT